MVLLLLAIFHSHLNYFTYNCKYVQSILLKKKRQYLKNNNGRQTPSPQWTSNVLISIFFVVFVVEILPFKLITAKMKKRDHFAIKCTIPSWSNIHNDIMYYHKWKWGQWPFLSKHCLPTQTQTWGPSPPLSFIRHWTMNIIHIRMLDFCTTS